MNDLDLWSEIRASVPEPTQAKLASGRARLLSSIATKPRERSQERFRRGRPAGRLRLIGAAAAAATLVAGGVTAGIALTGNGAAGGQAGPSEPAITLDAKTVAFKTVQALSQVGDVVEYQHISAEVNGKTYAGDLWVYGQAVLEQTYGPDGAPFDTMWVSVSNGATTTRQIFFTNRTWDQFSTPGSAFGSQASGNSEAIATASALKWAAENGRLRITGHAVIGGQQAIGLSRTSSWSAPKSAAGMARSKRSILTRPPAPPAYPGGPVSVAPDPGPAHVPAGVMTYSPSKVSETSTIWVSAATGLPLKATDTTTVVYPAELGGNTVTTTVVSAYQWLPKSRASLAHVQSPPAVPAGFTPVRPAGR